MVTVDEWRTACSPDALCIVDALRDAVMVANSNVEETIKWNAPSFAQHGRDRITLGLDRSGGARVVLHRGAQPCDDGFVFHDPDGLARWPSPDRGVMTFKDLSAVTDGRDKLIRLFRRWLEVTQ